MDDQVIQITKINTEDFIFKDIQNITFPIPPLASANFYNNDGVKTLKVCSTVYINSKGTEKPTVQRTTQDDNTLTIYYDYEWDEISPETYNVYYIETDYTSDTIGDITEVITYLKYTPSTTVVGPGDGSDPTISRGTRTSSGD
ncbi:hypothetical protein CLU81_3107 [Flavobacterium sp. 9]|uniref:hypothetical protein n=1 Tax=Flavobacterium sp. 9 TaxID=2035198 RepID=UPI000C18480B|nr:hypothetical protein [Flavobacterium sp. 9]PIF32561.1 hypothetical protein CLU81_3107 [Flavobacterium sp. 9]